MTVQELSLLSPISAAFVNPRLRNAKYIVTDRDGCVSLLLFPSFPPLTDDLLLHLPFFSSRSSISSFSVPRLGPPASLFHLLPSHSSPACLTTAANADVNSTWDGVYANSLLEIFSDPEAAPRVFMSINAASDDGIPMRPPILICLVKASGEFIGDV